MATSDVVEPLPDDLPEPLTDGDFVRLEPRKVPGAHPYATDPLAWWEAINVCPDGFDARLWRDGKVIDLRRHVGYLSVRDQRRRDRP